MTEIQLPWWFDLIRSLKRDIFRITSLVLSVFLKVFWSDRVRPLLTELTTSKSSRGTSGLVFFNLSQNIVTCIRKTEKTSRSLLFRSKTTGFSYPSFFIYPISINNKQSWESPES